MSEMRLIHPARGEAKLLVQGTKLSEVWKRLRLVPGVQKRTGCVTVPAETRLYELLQEMAITPDAEAIQWYARLALQEKCKASLLALSDAKLEHPEASKLYPFQRAGAYCIANAYPVMLCDDTGLGKTVQTVIGVECSPCHSRVLVVCLNTLKYWWEFEYHKWSAEGLATTVLESPTRDRQLERYDQIGGWLIANYKQLLIAPQLAQMSWDWVVFDEGHTLCNRATATREVAKNLRTARTLIVTATPYGNDPAEVWALLQLIAPHRFTSYWRFYELYVDYKENYFGGHDVKGVRNEALFKREMSLWMIRRAKTDVYAQLPAKIYQTVPLKLEGFQHDLYRIAAREALIELSNDEVLQIPNAAVLVTRLRQILSTPAAFHLQDASVKLDFVEDFLSNYTGKAVVFTLYRATVQAVMNRLDSLDIPATMVWGKMTAEEVEESRQKLLTDKARVLVGTIAGAGTGLNLRGAGVEAVIFVDRHFNPTKQMQAEDRVHGIGQTGQVTIYNLHCTGTVDELVERILAKKLAMTNAILGSLLREELQRFLGTWTEPATE